MEKNGMKMVSISGGSDSDIIIDICERNNYGGHYVFFDTGIEYEATFRHLDFLENRYGIEIERLKPEINVPEAIEKYGAPIFSKNITEYISRLQKHGFNWNYNKNEAYAKVLKTQSALNWFYNNNGVGSHFNIERKKGLREYLIQNNPPKCSNMCCKCAKVTTAIKYKRANNVVESVTGLRKAEGGIRAIAYKNKESFKNGIKEIRPIFFMTDNDKLEYNRVHDIVNSDCYSIYGLPRTGCAGCPLGHNRDNELAIIAKYEPDLYDSVTSLFEKSYDYMDGFKAFKAKVGSE